MFSVTAVDVRITLNHDAAALKRHRAASNNAAINIFMANIIRVDADGHGERKKAEMKRGFIGSRREEREREKRLDQAAAKTLLLHVDN